MMSGSSSSSDESVDTEDARVPITVTMIDEIMDKKTRDSEDEDEGESVPHEENNMFHERITIVSSEEIESMVNCIFTTKRAIESMIPHTVELINILLHLRSKLS